MNTKPDEIRIALWLEDELEGAERNQFDAWVALHPELLRQRDEMRSWKDWMKQSLPESASVPHAEFFQARVAREIRMAHADQTPVSAARHSGWRPFLLPVASAAGMAFCFWLGGRYGNGTGGAVAAGPVLPPVMASAALTPVLYTPESQVAAHAFSSEGAAATVIVLEGVDAMPDSFEVPDSAARDGAREATADNLPTS
jgi:hypothetical protein